MNEFVPWTDLNGAPCCCTNCVLPTNLDADQFREIAIDPELFFLLNNAAKLRVKIKASGHTAFEVDGSTELFSGSYDWSIDMQKDYDLSFSASAPVNGESQCSTNFIDQQINTSAPYVLPVREINQAITITGAASVFFKNNAQTLQSSVIYPSAEHRFQFLLYAGVDNNVLQGKVFCAQRLSLNGAFQFPGLINADNPGGYLHAPGVFVMRSTDTVDGNANMPIPFATEYTAVSSEDTTYTLNTTRSCYAKQWKSWASAVSNVTISVQEMSLEIIPAAP